MILRPIANTFISLGFGRTGVAVSQRHSEKPRRKAASRDHASARHHPSFRNETL